MPEDKSYFTISVLVKAFQVIDIMAREAKWELGTLTKESGLPKGTLQRILLTLTELGYVAREKGGQYALTLKYYKLGQRIAANNPMLEHARPSCRQLMQTVNETSNLCVPLNTDMVVIDQQVSWQMLRLDSVIGSSFPIFQSASGKAFCAFLDELSLMKVLEALRRASTGITDAQMDAFKEELATVRREGIAFDWEEIFQGVRCVSAPIFDCTGQVVATVGLSVPTVRIDPQKNEDCICGVLNCAAQISRNLGAPARSFSPCTRTMCERAFCLS
ncbi:MAG: IclR family transcriptional regulator [Desulfovibrio sp.]|nr:IclR family transcriptional regulator [Desulfovibrio sp.]